MDATFFAKRRRELINQIGNNIAIVPTSPIRPRNGDVEYQYRPDSDFFYVTGFNEPEAVAVICPGREQGEYVLFCREKDPLREMWDGTRAGLQGAVDLYGADDAFPIEDMDDILPSMMEDKDKIYTLVGRYPDFDSKVLGWINKIKAAIRQGKHAPYELVDVGHLLHEQRLIKRSDEIAVMKKAASISAQGHIAAMQNCKPGLYEYQVQAAMEYHFRYEGSNYNAYPSIVAGGDNANVLHYIENNSKLQDGDLLLIDAGAEFLEAQKAAFESCKPGNSWIDPHNAAVAVISQGLIDLGFVKGNLDQVIETMAYRDFYMHKTGHWLGMDVHDVGDYQLDEQWRELEAGMVFTVEPGLYVSQSADVDERFKGNGIRIEDNVLITKSGYEVLTESAPKTIDEIEGLMAA